MISNFIVKWEFNLFCGNFSCVKLFRFGPFDRATSISRVDRWVCVFGCWRVCRSFAVVVMISSVECWGACGFVDIFMAWCVPTSADWFIYKGKIISAVGGGHFFRSCCGI